MMNICSSDLLGNHTNLSNIDIEREDGALGRVWYVKMLPFHPLLQSFADMREQYVHARLRTPESPFCNLCEAQCLQGLRYDKQLIYTGWWVSFKCTGVVEIAFQKCQGIGQVDINSLQVGASIGCRTGQTEVVDQLPSFIDAVYSRLGTKGYSNRTVY